MFRKEDLGQTQLMFSHKSLLTNITDIYGIIFLS
jgi:hypothetical protein